MKLLYCSKLQIPVDADFYLGLARIETLLDNQLALQKGTLYPEYYAEIYDEGTICDLTGEPRQTTIHFYCASQQDTTVLTSVMVTLLTLSIYLI
jgi:hypothetical protein